MVVLASFKLLSHNVLLKYMIQPKAGEDPRNEDCGELILSYSAHNYDCMYIYIHM